MSFNFGKAGGTGGFAFGTTSTTTSTTGTPATGGFSFGGAAAGTSAQKPPAFSGFGTPSSGQNTGGFSFGQPSQQQSTFSLGGGQAKPTSGFNFGTPSTQPQTMITPSTQTQQPSGGFSFGAPSQQQTSGGAATPQSSGFNFGAKPATATTQQSSAGPGGIFGSSQGAGTANTTAGSTQQTTGFSFGGQGQSTQGSAPATQPSSSGFGGFASTSTGGVTPQSGILAPTLSMGQGQQQSFTGGFTLATSAPQNLTSGTGQQQQKPPPSFSMATSQQGIAAAPATITATPALPKPSALGSLLSAPTTTPAQPTIAATTASQPSSGVLQLGGATTQSGFKLGGGMTTGVNSGGGFQIGQPVAKTTAAETPGISFGSSKATAGPTIGGTGIQPSTLTMEGAKTTAATLSTLTATTTTTATNTGFKLSGFNSTTTSGGSNLTLAGKPLGQPTGTSTSTTVGLGTALAKSTATTATSGASLSTVTQTTASTSVPSGMNYKQLEEQINKWSLELEEQEKVFIQQATQVNAWDRLLIDNGDKIAQLNTDVDRVKLDQQRLDQELDFILAQQRELEEMLVPLEQTVEQIPAIHYQQHADLEREHTYKMAETIDAQLKRMVQDLKEIIDHINTTNTNQDDTDPVQQIAKVLNAHMDSLQWIDKNTVLLQRRVEEVSKRADQRKNEQERNLRLAYD